MIVLELTPCVDTASTTWQHTPGGCTALPTTAQHSNGWCFTTDPVAAVCCAAGPCFVVQEKNRFTKEGVLVMTSTRHRTQRWVRDVPCQLVLSPSTVVRQLWSWLCRTCADIAKDLPTMMNTTVAVAACVLLAQQCPSTTLFMESATAAVIGGCAPHAHPSCLLAMLCRAAGACSQNLDDCMAKLQAMIDAAVEAVTPKEIDPETVKRVKAA